MWVYNKTMDILVRYFKKIGVFLLSLLLIAVIIPYQNFNAIAEQCTGQCGQDSWFYYETLTGSMTINGTGAIGSYKTGSEWIYPGDKGWLTARGSYFYGVNNLSHIYISEGITSIGGKAFHSYVNDNVGHITYLSSVNDVRVPTTVSWIGENFTYCSVDVYINDLAKWIECGKGFTNSLIKNLYLNDEIISDDTTVVIPAGTTKIAKNALRGWKSPKKVIIPDSVTSIEPCAFENCKTLEEITFGNGLTTINQDAFSGCTGLKSINIPNSVTSIGDRAFYGCTGLTNIDIPDSVTLLGYHAFENCTALVDANIPNSLDSVPGYIFAGCTELKYVTLGSSVKTIGINAFENCTGLETINISDSVTSVNSNAFYGCTGLTSITIPGSVTRIGADAFYGCSGLASIIFDNCATSIGDRAFYGCTGLTNIILGNGVTSIGESTFSGCIGLTNITIPNSVTSIGKLAFYGCTALSSIEMSDCIGNIGVSVFNQTAWYNNQPAGLVYAGNVALQIKGSCPSSITLKEGTVCIADSAFSNCTLGSIKIPASVTSIGENAFYNCKKLYCVRISDISAWCNIKFNNEYSNPLYYAHSLFLNNDHERITDLVIPDGVKSISERAFSGCTGLTKVNFTGTVSDWCNISFSYYVSNPLYYAHNLYINDELVTDVVIPDTVKEIKIYAFYGCTGLTSITIPDSVISIGNYAFYGCTGLTNIEIPDSVTSIGGYAFSGCAWLTNIEIPDGIKRIDGGTFSGCLRLTSITIPNSVSLIGYRAFYDCYWLKTVYYSGTENQKLQISIDTSNSKLTNATWHYNCTPEHAKVLQKIEEMGETLRSVYMRTAIQTKAGTSVSDESYDLRLISMIDCLDYDEIGFYITIDGYNDVPIKYSTDTAYTSFLNGENRVYASDYGAQYFSMVTMTVPNEYYSANITIQPYIIFNDGTEFSGNPINTTVSKYVK